MKMSFLVLVVTFLTAAAVGTTGEKSHQEQASNMLPVVSATHAVAAWQQRATADMLKGRSTNSAVWTGKDLIVFGGEGMNVSFGDGARYNFANDRWQVLPRAGEPSERTSHSGIWTGKEMIIWGGVGGSYGNNINRNDGARYNPSKNKWRPVSNENAPTARFQHTAVWTGKEMLIWGGYTDSHAFYAGCHANAALNTGGRYNPRTNVWKDISTEGAPEKRLAHVALWTGKEMIIWGGTNATKALNNGGLYNPRTNSWRPMNMDGAPSPRAWLVAVWTGTEMIVWGGSCDNEYFCDGARYNPYLDKWTPISSVNAPKGRIFAKGLWTGTDMVLWGGVNDEDVTGVGDPNRYLNTGARYNPITNTWTPITTENSPSGRLANTVWTGDGMLIFGGYNNVHLNDTWFFPISMGGVSKAPFSEAPRELKIQEVFAKSLSQNTAYEKFRGKVVFAVLHRPQRTWLADGGITVNLIVPKKPKWYEQVGEVVEIEARGKIVEILFEEKHLTIECEPCDIRILAVD